VGAGSALLLGPYLFVQTGTTGGGLQRSAFHYASWELLRPGAWLFPGWWMLALAALGLLVPRAWVLPRISGDPRWVLLLGGALSGAVALGSNLGPLPNLHALFATFLPGLDAVRVVLRVFAGPHLILALLAGLGAAACIGRSGRAGPAVAALVVAGCLVQVLGAPMLGLPRPYEWAYEEVVIDPEEIAFYRELAERGNEGPLLEIPLDQTEHHLWLGPPRILMSLFHERRTSACFGSYTVPGRDALMRHVQALPRPAAIAAIVDQGFTTLVFDHSPGRPGALAKRAALGRAVERGQPGIESAHATRERAAFALSVPAVPAEGHPR
jgi:hypothetical protein